MNRLKRILKEKDITQKELSWKTKIHINMIYAYCRDSSVPTVYKALKIADALGVDVRDIWFDN